MTAVRRDSDRGGTDEWRMDSPVCSSSGGDGTTLVTGANLLLVTAGQ